MTPNQRIFADEYLKDRNATRAYMAAYKRVKGPDVAAANASALLRNPKVSDYVKRRLDELSSAAVADAREILEFHTAVMRGEITERVLRYDGFGSQALTENPPRLTERIAAARELAKLLGVDKPAELMEDAPRIIEVRPDA